MRVGNVHVPILSILLPFTIGIVITEYWARIPMSVVAVGGIAMSFLSLLFSLKYRHKSFFYLGFTLLSFFLGVTVHNFQNPKNKKAYYHNQTGTEAILTHIQEEGKPSPDYFKYKANLLSIRKTKKWQEASAGVLVYVPKKDSASIQVGEVLLLNEQLSAIPAPRNPGEFDYQKYLEHQGLHYQVRATKGRFERVAHKNSIFIGLLKYRTKLAAVFSLYMKEESAAVAKALVLGYRDDLSNQTVKTYQKSGAMHVLAVSGLHVGIVFLMLKFLFRRRGLRRLKGWQQSAFIIVAIWAYVVLSGMAVSVIRASIMFSVIELGSLLGRKSNSFNALFASAFIVLLWKPTELFQVGFQFSYLAVLGILLCYPVMRFWIVSKYKWVNAAWSLLAVSISAQLSIGLLSAFYFHSFPLVFPISNFVVIPLAGLQVGLGFGLLLCSKWSFVAALLGKTLEASISFQITALDFLNQWPFLQFRDLWFSPTQLILGYGLIVCFVIWMLRKKSATIPIALFCILGLVVNNGIENYRKNGQEKLVAFGANDWCLAYIKGAQAYVYLGDRINPNGLDYFAIPALREQGVENITICRQEEQYAKGRVHLHQKGVFRVGDEWFVPYKVWKDKKDVIKRLDKVTLLKPRFDRYSIQTEELPEGWRQLHLFDDQIQHVDTTNRDQIVTQYKVLKEY